jgi:purine-nucleoside phosphorylase
MDEFSAQQFLSEQLSPSTLTSLQAQCHQKTVILIYLMGGTAQFREEMDTRGFTRINAFFNLYESPANSQLLFGPAPFSSVAMITRIQELAVLGVSDIIHIGLAGSFAPDLSPGSYYISTGAYSESLSPYIITDIPVSFNPQAKNTWFLAHTFKTSENLTSRLQTCLKNHHIPFQSGLHFMTDFIFLENTQKFAEVLKRNAKVVEMEGAALFAVCAKNHIQAAAIYIISDHLSTSGWDHHFHETLPCIQRAIDALLSAY